MRCPYYDMYSKEVSKCRRDHVKGDDTCFKDVQ